MSLRFGQSSLLCFYDELRVSSISFAFLPIFLIFTASDISVPYLTLLLTSSLPGFASSYIACFVSGPPGPSKSRAFVGLGLTVSFSAVRPRPHSILSRLACLDSTYRPDPPFSPGLEIISPPSSTGISRLSPAPEAAEPTLIVLPGNLFVTLVSTPDSVAVGERY